MDIAALLDELFGRIPPLARDAVDGLDPDALVAAPAPGANTIAWLVWHSARVQDDHVGEVMGTDQIWQHGDWAARFELEPDAQNTGYGHTPDDVARVRPVDAAALVDYLDAVHARTVAWLRDLESDDLDRVVDTRWDPPV